MTKAEKLYLSKVAELGCMICKRPAEIHHIRTGQGHMRAKHDQVIPLCHEHHRTGGYGVAIHAGIKGWEANFGSEIEMLEKVKKMFDIV
jgi:hypothetical protein